MNRRTFLRVAALPAVVAAARTTGVPSVARAQQKEVTPRPGTWRTFEITTRVEILEPTGVSRAWLPIPSVKSDYQRLSAISGRATPRPGGPLHRPARELRGGEGTGGRLRQPRADRSEDLARSKPGRAPGVASSSPTFELPDRTGWPCALRRDRRDRLGERRRDRGGPGTLAVRYDETGSYASGR